jgi:hypothetical protein
MHIVFPDCLTKGNSWMCDASRSVFALSHNFSDRTNTAVAFDLTFEWVGGDESGRERKLEGNQRENSSEIAEWLSLRVIEDYLNSQHFEVSAASVQLDPNSFKTQ